VEKLAELLNHHPNGLLLFRDELSGWLHTMDRPGHENDRAFYSILRRTTVVLLFSTASRWSTQRLGAFVRGESPSPGMLRRGDQILKPLRFLSCEAKMVRYHHERYDGRGYPDGLKGEASRSSPGSSRWRTRSTQ